MKSIVCGQLFGGRKRTFSDITNEQYVRALAHLLSVNLEGHTHQGAGRPSFWLTARCEHFLGGGPDRQSESRDGSVEFGPTVRSMYAAHGIDVLKHATYTVTPDGLEVETHREQSDFHVPTGSPRTIDVKAVSQHQSDGISLGKLSVETLEDVVSGGYTITECESNLQYLVRPHPMTSVDAKLIYGNENMTAQWTVGQYIPRPVEDIISTLESATETLTGDSTPFDLLY